MEKTLILGNNPEAWWITELKDFEIREVPNFATNRTSDIINYVMSLPDDIGCLAIDVDSLNADNPELALDIALDVRLMLHSLRHTSLCDIILVSDLGMNALKGYGPKSMLLMTQNVSLTGSEEAVTAIDNASPMSPSEYVEGFVALIKVEPQSKLEGRHSIANQWGADVLARVVAGEGISEMSDIQSSSSTYFNYCKIVALNADDVAKIISNNGQDNACKKIIVKEKFKYLLIDDEADKGWEKVLRLMMPEADGDVWCEKASDYKDLDRKIRTRISNRDYDIIFLDLRMAGVEEEGVINPDKFSGMKILKEIKRINPGIQVIMLTATNKGWNVKAMLDAGADGYYMKESPEYHFPTEYSVQNALSLYDTIKYCFGRKYLKDIYYKIQNIDFNLEQELTRLVKNQLLISYDLVSKAKSRSEYAFAYISLEMVFEIVEKEIFEQDYTEDGKWICSFKNHDKCHDMRSLNTRFRVSNHSINNNAMWVRIAAIYYFLFDGDDKDFAKNVQEDIKLRNDYIHPNNARPNITEVNYQNLFDTVYDFLTASL